MHILLRLSLLFIPFLLIPCGCTRESAEKPAGYPETYTSSDAVRSGIALGGIGTGSIELRKDGNFYNWSIFNNFPHGTGPVFTLPSLPNTSNEDSYLFFLVRYQVEGESPKVKLLQINNSLNEAALESISYYYPWMTAVEKIEYSGKFPFVNMRFQDKEMPFSIELEAFSPFIPHDVKNSSLPGVYFNFTIRSHSEKPVDVMLVGSLRNLVGYDVMHKSFSSEMINEDSLKFFIHSAEGMDSSHSSYGNMGLGIIGGQNVSWYLGWEHKHPYYEKLLVNNRLANIDDTEGRNFMLNGKKIGRPGRRDNDQRCFSSVASSCRLNKNEKLRADFLMNWYFPNLYGAVSKPVSDFDRKKDYSTNLKHTKIIGHNYQNYFTSINDLAVYLADKSDELRFRSQRFLNTYYDSDIDEFVLNQVNSHLNTFITSSILTRNKTFLIREGLTPAKYWGPMATIDVSLYGSQMIINLFPELQMSMMRAHKNLQTPDGEINHGLGYDPDLNQNGTFGVYERVDLVPNYIQMVLRDYFYTNDKSYLEEMWPSVKKGISHILEHRDKDGDQMPDMEGIMCSYDNFPMYGLASYIQSQWIAAVRMASIAARDMGESDLSDSYQAIAEKAVELMEAKLWNGQYFRLSNDYLAPRGKDEGCLTDQLIGQWFAHTAGLGTLFDQEKISSSLNSIMERSFMDNHFLRNCSWPEYPDLYPIHETNLWVDQANTPWTGVELAFASFLIYENKLEEGLKVIKAVDNRYRKAGLYWDHQEFGGHYYRPMSAWSIINAWLGFSINRGLYTFAPKIVKDNYKLFFSGPEGTAFFIRKPESISIEALTGKQRINALQLSLPSGSENLSFQKNEIKINPESVNVENGVLAIDFTNQILLDEGEKLIISFTE